LSVWERIDERVQELAHRAGMREVPSAVVGAALIVAALVVGWALWRWWPTPGNAAGGAEMPPVEVASAGESRVETPSASDSASAATTPAVSRVVVHVAGRVRHPGVYELAAGSRVVTAIEAAGGALGSAQVDALNLARVVADGEQILVPSKDEVHKGSFSGGAGGGPSTSGAASGDSAGGGGAAVNINTADASALDTLPGVGPSTAQKIIAEREANGPFAKIEDLGRVSGIGPKRLEQLKGLVSVQ
jgi:competence protein ComEA